MFDQEIKRHQYLVSRFVSNDVNGLSSWTPPRLMPLASSSKCWLSSFLGNIYLYIWYLYNSPLGSSLWISPEPRLTSFVHAFSISADSSGQCLILGNRWVSVHAHPASQTVGGVRLFLICGFMLMEPWMKWGIVETIMWSMIVGIFCFGGKREPYAESWCTCVKE